MPMMPALKGVVIGALAGVGYAITGFFKAKAKNKEDFDYKKFAKTVALGAILGAVNYYLGLGMTGDDIAFLALAGETAVIEHVIKAIFAKISGGSSVF